MILDERLVFNNESLKPFYNELFNAHQTPGLFTGDD